MAAPGRVIVVKAAYDSDAGVWYVEHSDLPGVNLEAPTLDRLRELIPAAVLDLLEAKGDTGPFDVPIEIIAHASARARGGAVAA